MPSFSRWLPSVLVVLAVFVLAGTVPLNGVVVDAVLITVAVGLLIVSYLLRHRARKRLIYDRDRVSELGQPKRPEATSDGAPQTRKPAP